MSSFVMGLSGKHKRVDWQVSLPLTNVTLRRWGRRAAALLGAYAWARWYTANFSVSLQQALLDTLRASKQRALERAIERARRVGDALRPLRHLVHHWRPRDGHGANGPPKPRAQGKDGSHHRPAPPEKRHQRAETRVARSQPQEEHPRFRISSSGRTRSARAHGFRPGRVRLLSVRCAIG